MTRRPWREAWEDALYGPAGFYLRPEGPAGHFRTAPTASSSGLLGRALAGLARCCGCNTVVDVGAGRGELLLAVGAADPRLRLVGVDRAPRRPGLPSAVEWLAEAPAPMPRTLLVGWELLDVVPCPVLEVDGPAGLREVLVDVDGAEALGGQARGRDLAWCRRWWRAAGARSRVEVGHPRDELWAGLVDRLTDGVALAVDYGHLREARPTCGTLTGFRAGRQVRPVPDGATDLTAHVALDSLAAALPDGPDRLTACLLQADALAALGVSAARPGRALAVCDPVRYLRLLTSAGEAAELLDRSGLGGFTWVLHGVGPAARQGLDALLVAAAGSTAATRG